MIRHLGAAFGHAGPALDAGLPLGKQSVTVLEAEDHVRADLAPG